MSVLDEVGCIKKEIRTAEIRHENLRKDVFESIHRNEAVLSDLVIYLYENEVIDKQQMEHIFGNFGGCE